MNLILIGYRGSGKSTVGRLLAGRLGRRWIDLDDVIVRRERTTIRAVFEQRGEAAFRDLESAAVTALSPSDNDVVSVGGGAVLRESNRRRLREVGRCVWLTAGPATLWRRISGDAASADQRPPLSSQAGPDEVAAMLQAREPYYRELAGLTLDTDTLTAADVADRIAAWWRQEAGAT